MNLATVAALTAILAGLFVAWSRLPRRPRRWVLALLLLPGAVLLCRWTSYRSAWAELAAAAVASIGLVLLWWRLYGRRLPPPHEGDIRVWSNEDPF